MVARGIWDAAEWFESNILYHWLTRRHCTEQGREKLRGPTYFNQEKGKKEMNTELKILNLENRIAKLEANPKDNSRIVIKLKRQLKNLRG